MGRLGRMERRYLAEILNGLITRDYMQAAQVHFDAGYVPPHPFGGDLSSDHPVSFVYDAGLATTDGFLFDPTATAASSLCWTTGGSFVWAAARCWPLRSSGWSMRMSC